MYTCHGLGGNQVHYHISLIYLTHLLCQLCCVCLSLLAISKHDYLERQTSYLAHLFSAIQAKDAN